MTDEEMWKAFCLEEGMDIETEYDSWAFGGTDSMADELAALVLEGKKTATASWYDEYVFDNVPIPEKGAYSVILNSKDEALCIVRNYCVSCVPFREVTHWHAYLEGEGDRSLRHWRNVHEDFFSDAAERIGDRFDDRGRVVLEKFTVVYPKEAADRSDLLFLEPSPDMAPLMDAYRQEFQDFGSSMDGAGIRAEEDIKEWVERKMLYADPVSVLPENIVRATQLIAFRKSDGKPVGTIQIRHELNDYLRKYAGHVGYSVRPSERRKGYAKAMLREVVPYCRALGIDDIHISCVEGNEGSRRTILSAGGKYIDMVTEPDRGLTLERYHI